MNAFRRSSNRLCFLALCLASFSGCKEERKPLEGSASPEATSATSTTKREEPGETAKPTPDNVDSPVAKTNQEISGSSPPEAAASAAPAKAADPPASFEAGTEKDVTGAIGLGCEANTLDGWLQLVCGKKNSTGGHPVRAVFASDEDARATLAALNPSAGDAPTADGPAAPASAAGPDAGTNVTVPADENRELRVVVPLRDGAKSNVMLEWSDRTYELIVDGTKARLSRPDNLEQRKVCAALERESRAIVDTAEKEGRLTSADRRKLPRLGRCLFAGDGGWATALGSIEATGEGPERRLDVGVDVIHVDEKAKLTRGELGHLVVAPEGLELPRLMVFDFDGDGRHEVVVRYEVSKRAQGETSAQTAPAAVFSFVDGRVVRVDTPSTSFGSLSVEQLSPDMRPDLADYGPFVAWLGKDCGASSCPDRITGPRFFMSSKPDGTFARNTPDTQGALKRGCQRKPEAIVARVGSGLNVKTTALRVACARVFGVATEHVVNELRGEKIRLCGDAESCPLLTTLERWATSSAPETLSAE